MEILPVTKNDLPQCAPAFMAAYNALPWNYKWQLPDAVSYLEEYTGTPRYAGFMLRDGGQVWGGLLGHGKTWWTGHQFMIDELFVNPEAQGRGYGKALLQHAEQYAQQNGIKAITLMTNKYMPALEFYNKAGFTRVDQYVFMFKEK